MFRVADVADVGDPGAARLPDVGDDLLERAPGTAVDGHGGSARREYAAHLGADRTRGPGHERDVSSQGEIDSVHKMIHSTE
ncbi:hypothetical protein GCM10027176_39660 [Actinoallomurus bryophytorum]